MESESVTLYLWVCGSINTVKEILWLHVNDYGYGSGNDDNDDDYDDYDDYDNDADDGGGDSDDEDYGANYAYDHARNKVELLLMFTLRMVADCGHANLGTWIF